MSKFNGSIAVINVQEFNNGSSDVNGNLPVFLSPIAGTMPFKNLLNGTIASNSGFEINGTYMVSVDELEEDAEYGRQFRFTNLGKLSIMDIITAKRELGSPSREEESATVADHAMSDEDVAI